MQNKEHNRVISDEIKKAIKNQDYKAGFQQYRSEMG